LTPPDASSGAGKPITATYAVPTLPRVAATAKAAAAAAPPSAATATRSAPPVARPLATIPSRRSAAPIPIAPTLVASYQQPRQRPVVDLVPVTPGAGALTFVAPTATGTAAATTKPLAPPRSRVGLYSVLVALLVGGAGLIGWRQWSARPGSVEITTTPADAVISVGNDALTEHSPALLERPPGTYQISVAREGFQHTHRTVELRAGEELELFVALTPSRGAAQAEAAAEAAGEGEGDRPDGPATAPLPAARPAAANPTTAARHPTAGGSAARPVTAARPGTRSDPRIAAMLAARSGERETLPTLAIETNHEPAAPAAPSKAASAAATSDLGGALAAAEIAGARTVSGRVAKAQLLIDPNTDEYRVSLPPSLARAEMKLAAVVKICVSTEGKVAGVKLLKSADPAVDPQIRAVLARWRFRPLLIDSRPVPFCYTTQYEIADR